MTTTGRAAIPERELRWQFSHASGPGGQGVNTADSRVQLRWTPATSEALTDAQRERVLQHLAGRLRDGDLIVVSERYRSQRRNRDDARARLQAILAEALAPPPPRRRATRPGRGAVERRIAGKKQRGQVKRDRRTPPTD